MGKFDLSKNRYSLAVVLLIGGLLALATQDVVMKNMTTTLLVARAVTHPWCICVNSVSDCSAHLSAEKSTSYRTPGLAVV